MRFAAGINNQRSSTPPVPVSSESANTVNVRGRIGTGKGYPEEVIKSPCRELAVIYDNNKWKNRDRILYAKEVAKGFHVRTCMTAAVAYRSAYSENPRHADLRG